MKKFSKTLTCHISVAHYLSTGNIGLSKCIYLLFICLPVLTSETLIYLPFFLLLKVRYLEVPFRSLLEAKSSLYYIALVLKDSYIGYVVQLTVIFSQYYFFQ